MNEQTRRRKQRDLNKLRGIPNRLPSIEAARHIEALRATMSWSDLAQATGASACHLRRIKDGLEPRINRVTHTKIMAITPDPGGWRFVDSLGSRRRIHALQVRGHSQYDIADAARSTQYRIYMISNGRVASVRLHLSQRIAEAYTVLAPLEGTSARGRNLAAKNGWAGPEYWDPEDFDNPDFVPATGRVPRYIVLAENCLELERQELNREQIAERLGVTRDGLQRALALYRRKQTEAAA